MVSRIRRALDDTGRALSGGLAALVLATPALAQPAAAGHAMTTQDLGAFFDGMMSQRLERDDIAGAAVVVVKNGQVLFEKGYGFADVARHRPIEPDRTVFEMASISKTFTGTAVMQLVEAGKLDLDADVQRYLDFKLRKRFPDPITLRNLLIHTAGFEEVAKDFNDLPGQFPALGQYLASHQPGQLYRPGARIGYSNYGNSLAGYIVERVSGEPFETYVQRHIFAPLGMAHSSFSAPLPPALAALQTKQYWVASQPPRPGEYLPLRPSGGLHATADDMSRFLIAQLQDGRFGDGRILGDAAARTLHTVQWRGNPQGPGIAIAFYQDVGNGRFVLTHGGDLCCQHSELWLVPSENVGVFVIFNSTGKDFGHIRSALWKAFIDRYWPAGPQAPATWKPTKADLAAVTGVYAATRRADSNIFGLVYALSSWGKVTANPDGTISFSNAKAYGSGAPIKFRPAAPLLFRNDDGHTLSFARDGDGVVRRLVVDSAGGWERRGVNGELLVNLFTAALLVLAMSVLMWPVTAVARWRYGRPLADALDVPARRRRLGVKAATLAALALVFGAVVYLLQATSALDASLFTGRMDWLLRLFQLLAILVVAGAGWAVWTAGLAWKRGEGSIVYRIAGSVVAAALVTLAIMILGFNVLTLSLNY